MEKKEETENRPLEEREQSMVSGLEGFRRCVFKRQGVKKGHLFQIAEISLKMEIRIGIYEEMRELRFVLWKG